MSRVFYFDVTKVYLVLHMMQWSPPTAAAYCSCRDAVHAVPCEAHMARKRVQAVPACVIRSGAESGSHVRVGSEAETGYSHVRAGSAGRATHLCDAGC